MRRRDLIAASAGLAIGLPQFARAQKPATPVVGFLNSASPAPFAPLVAAFRRGMQETGYVEGRNLAITFRWAENRLERLPRLAAELVGLRVAVIAASGGPAPALAAKAATSTIPIVFTVGSDPVRLGLIGSLSHPGHNITGTTFFTAGLDGKRLDLLHQLVPKARRVAMLVNPGNPDTQYQLRDAAAAARALGLEITVLKAADRQGLDAALAPQASTGAGALLVGADPLFQPERIIGAVARLGLPAIYELGAFVRAGGLISYGAKIAEAYHQMGVSVGRILNGEKPDDLPVQLPTKFELVINLKTARTLGLTVPPALLALADDVIE
jgi:putative tryptophan/tyrosine transport system substrate-binding protein